MMPLLRGIYSAAAGMVSESVRQEVIANNLANADTTGFKRALLVTRPMMEIALKRVEGRSGPGDPVPIGTFSAGSKPDEAVPVFTQGALRSTGGVLDLALQGEGFFAVQTPAGVRYTRDGSFRVDVEGYLVTASGYRVLGKDGAIRLGDGEPVIGESGDVTVGGRSVGKLRLAVFEKDTRLEREGQNLFRAPEEAMEREAGGQVRQRYLEMSNVQPVREMVDLIAVMRAYEANQRAIKAHDETLGRAVNDIARF